MAAAIIVLVVEDDALIRQLIEETLEEGGFTISSASTGKQAMALLDAQDANYQALTTDVDLKGKLSGWDVARHAREINDGLPVIYMTGASAHEWASKGVPNSILLAKPFAAAQLVTAVAQLLNAASGKAG